MDDRSPVFHRRGSGPFSPPGSRDRPMPLREAAEKGDESIWVLVEAGADRDCFDRSLRWAAAGGFTDVVRYLVENGAGSTGYDEEENMNTGIILAAQRGFVGTVFYLLEHVAYDGLTLLYAAQQCFKKDFVELIARHFDYPRAAEVAQGWDAKSAPVLASATAAAALEIDLQSPLTDAARRGHIDIVRYLLSLGADPNGGCMLTENPGDRDMDIRSPLTAAVKAGCSEIVSDLLDCKADIRIAYDIFGWPLSDAVAHAGILKLLINRGRALELLPPRRAQEAVRAAMWNDEPVSVQMLEAVLNILFQSGYAPKPGDASSDEEIVYLAVEKGNIPLLQYLASAGFSLLNSPPPEVQAALIVWAVTESNAGSYQHHSEADVLDFLIQQGFVIDALNPQGQTPLLEPMSQHCWGTAEFAEVLITRGADSCFRSAAGECPLVTAATFKERFARNGEADAVRVLLQAAEEQGVDSDVIESQVREALAVAETVGSRKLLKPLRQWYWRRRYPVQQ
ncbi:ankyrin repeat-containing domain protein [Aspergillus crustosus]